MKNITCSKLARPMICTGYMSLDFPKAEYKTHGEEGEAAGEYLDRLLTDKPLPAVSSKGMIFDDEMKLYARGVNQDVRSRANSPVLCEQTIDWQTRSGIWVKGRYDIAFVDKEGTLCVEDYKYGWNLVEVKENWQLLGYAIGEIIRRGVAFEKISLRIHQPRPHHEDGDSRVWTLTYAQLIEYKEKIELRMEALVNGVNDLQTSSQCKHCEGVAESCPAFSRLFYRALEVSTEFTQDSLTNEEVASQIDHVKRAKEVIKIKEDSLTELAGIRIRAGELIPGYVTTESYGHRSWNAGVSPESIKLMTGIDAVETKFMSPAKVEKLGIPKELIDQLAKKKFIGIKLTKKDTTKLGNELFGDVNPNGGN